MQAEKRQEFPDGESMDEGFDSALWKNSKNILGIGEQMFDSFVVFTWCMTIGLFSLVLAVPNRTEVTEILKPGHDIKMLQVAGSTILLSLGCEFVMETIIEVNFPRIGFDYSRGRWEYGVLVMSLVFSSTMTPYFFVPRNDEIDTLICWAHVGKAIAVFGIINKVHKFGKEIWNPNLSVSTVVIMWILTVIRLFASRPRDGIVDYLSNRDRNNLLIAANILSGIQAVYLFRAAISLYYEHGPLATPVSIPSKPKTKTNTITAPPITQESSIKAIYRFTCITLSCALSIALLFDSVEKTYLRLNSIGDDPETLLYCELRTHIMLIAMTALLPLRLLRNRLIEVVERTKLTDATKGFMRYIVHEVRSPLTTTLLGLQCLQSIHKPHDSSTNASKQHTSAEFQELIEDCQFSCQTAMQILNDLLMYDKMERKTIVIESVRTVSKDFLCNCIRPFRRQLQMDEKQFTVLMEEQTLQHVYVDIDVSKMEQVIRNFITNAMKFTACKRGTIAISAKFVSDDSVSFKDRLDSNTSAFNKTSQQFNIVSGQLYVEVADNGVGIAEKNLPRLFGQYIQIDPSKLQGGKGSGLGLFLSKKIVELHKGKIGVSSAGEGHGSRFFFSLPAIYEPPISYPLMKDTDHSCNSNTSSPNMIKITHPKIIVTFATPNSLNEPLSNKLHDKADSPSITPSIQSNPTTTHADSGTTSDTVSIHPMLSRTLSGEKNSQHVHNNIQESNSLYNLHYTMNLDIHPSHSTSSDSSSLPTSPSSRDTSSRHSASLYSTQFSDSFALTNNDKQPTSVTNNYYSKVINNNFISPSTNVSPLNNNSSSCHTSQLSSQVIAKLNRARTRTNSTSNSHHTKTSLLTKANLSSKPIITSGMKDISEKRNIFAKQSSISLSTMPPLRVLIADDSSIARKMVARILIETIGAEIIHASNGFEAIELVKDSLLSDNFSFDSCTEINDQPEKLENDDNDYGDDEEVRTILTNTQNSANNYHHNGEKKTSGEKGLELLRKLSCIDMDSWKHVKEETEFGSDKPDNIKMTNINKSKPTTENIHNTDYDHWNNNINNISSSRSGIDVILMDYHMPGMDGPATVKELRELGYTGCILALSAVTDAADRRQFLSSGANAVLIKPFNLQTFIDTVYDRFGAECSLEYAPTDHTAPPKVHGDT